MENHHPTRKDFQIDRLILFTDAVFAIAITLLIIEIKVPEIHGAITENNFIEAMVTLIPKFSGFAISFFIIGLYWFVHHTMFGYVINYTSKLIWINIIFLFSIVIMPFSTAVYSEYSTNEEYASLISPFAVYVANICFTGIMNFVLLSYIFNPKNNISEHSPSNYNIKLAKKRALIIPIIFIITLIITYFIPGYGRLFLFSIPIFMRFLKAKKTETVKLKKKH